MFAESREEQVSFVKKTIQVIQENRVIDWTEKEDIKREMRKDIRRKLKAKGCPEESLEPLIVEIMALAGRHMKDT